MGGESRAFRSDNMRRDAVYIGRMGPMLLPNRCAGPRTSSSSSFRTKKTPPARRVNGHAPHAVTLFPTDRTLRVSPWFHLFERAGAARTRIVRIHDPAGNARTRTFDHGRLDIAVLNSKEEHRKD